MTPVPGAQHQPAWPFAAWAATGAALFFALAGILTVGLFVLPVVIAAVAALIIWPGSRNSSALGLVTGLGVVPLFIAYLNKGGPGTVCSASAAMVECTDEWSPWPFLAAGVLLIAAGAVVFTLLRRRQALRTSWVPGGSPRS